MELPASIKMISSRGQHVHQQFHSLDASLFLEALQALDQFVFFTDHSY